MKINSQVSILSGRYLSILLSIAAAPFYFVFNSIAAGFGNYVIIIISLFAISLFLNVKKYILISNILLLSNAILGTIYYSYSLPLEAGVYNLFYALFLFPFLIFNYTQRALVFTFTIIPAMMLVCRIYNVFDQFVIIRQIQNIEFVNSFSVAIIALIIISFTFFFTKEIYSSQQQLAKKNDDLNKALNRLKESRDAQVMLTQHADYAKLVQSIAHEFKNPLQMLQGTAEIGLKKDKKNEKLFETIISSVERLNNVIQPLLLYLNKKTQYEFKPFSPVKTIEEIIILSKANCKAKKINLTFQNNLKKHQNIFGDSQFIGQVIINLITNSIESISNDSNGKIEIQLNEDAFISQNKTIPGIQMRIIDTGCGIPKDKLKTIFLPYESNSKSANNLGLGLPIVAKIIKDHQGALKIDSDIDLGTTVSVWLPISSIEYVTKHENQVTFELNDSFFES